MDNTSFRLATLADADSLLAMIRRFYHIDNYPFSDERKRPVVEKLLKNPELGEVWFLEKEGQVIGYFFLAFGYSFEFDGRDAFVDEVFIEAPFRGKGFGRQLLEYALQRANELGIKYLHLEVERHNEAGKNLYRSLGFKDHDRYLFTKKMEG